MGKERECAMKLREIVKKPGYESYLCTVTATDGATCDVTRVLDGKIVKDVRLNATISESDGLVIVPKAESYVLITNIDGDKWFVSQFSTIEKILLNVEDKIEINGGTNGGLTITPSLVEELNKNNQILEAILNAVSSPVNEPGNGSPSAFQAALNVALAGKQTGDFSAIENDKITH